MKKNFSIASTQMGQKEGLSSYESVILDHDTAKVEVTNSGAAIFTDKADTVIYAPGTWVIITVVKEE